MKFSKTEKGYIIRLLKGEKIIERLTSFCNQNSIESGVFQGIGAVMSAELGFYHLDKKEYEFKKIENLMEIVSMTGNVALVEGQPFLHIHTVLSDENLQTIGGHLKEAQVGATCELFLTKFETPVERVFDEETGLKLLNCSQNS
jgi:predicted DNA-binding protein with PD1-like motif